MLTVCWQDQTDLWSKCSLAISLLLGNKEPQSRNANHYFLQCLELSELSYPLTTISERDVFV